MSSHQRQSRLAFSRTSSKKSKSNNKTKNDESITEWRKLFKELDELLLEGITSQIQNLCSYFRMEIRKHVAITSDQDHEFEDFDTSELPTIEDLKQKFGDENVKLELPDHVQQLLVEYTCLPVCRISVDPTPSRKFSLTFINEVLFRQLQLNTVFSENVSELFSRVILPLLSSESDEDYGAEVISKKRVTLNINQENDLIQLKNEKKKQFIEFLNSYFASLVFVCQYELLKQLNEWMFLFSTNVKIWIIKAFFTKYITTSESKCKPLKELAQKVLSKHQKLLIQEEGSYVKYVTQVEFLTDQIINQDRERLINPPQTKASIASQLVLRILDMAVNDFSQDLSKRARCLKYCIDILKYGNLYSIMETEDTKRKKKPSSSSGSIRGFSLLLTKENGEKMMELLWHMLYAFIDLYDSPNYELQPNNARKQLLHVGAQLVTLFDLIYPSVQNKEVTNYFYLSDCFIPLLLRILRTLNAHFENSDMKNCIKEECRAASIAVKTFIKHSTKTSNTLDALQFFKVHEEPGHCSKMSMKKFLSDISEGLLFESLLNSSKLLLKESLSQQTTDELYYFVERVILYWTNFFFYLYNACSLERIANPNTEAHGNDEMNESANGSLPIFKEEQDRYRHLDKLNVIFVQLVECACLCDYNHFINKSLSTSPASDRSNFAKKAQDLNELLRAILVVIFQKPFITSFLSTDNQHLVAERLGIKVTLTD
ncbi:hypothetical protein FDP41_002224 [Naegleria fowleri]|uniref:Uncharacterized protein n=1 Tax=Naegleria fowleri TaxID=5763 RepID=A0A6A5BVV0_NAEFO|nr:uncharacterized protein FDP41_002224 [Naegleria fowleri]KAF0978404.1 hypothetical protein FDP41_002224 [Naegleria fowleri]CAG4714722.1 unnamed protein product [Naegleria fowleri]